MRRLLIGAICAITVVLAGCTPDEIAAVVNDYAARTTAKAWQAPSIEPTCDVLYVTGDGWPDGSNVAVSIGSDPPAGGAVIGGHIDIQYSVSEFHRGGYTWTVAVAMPDDSTSAYWAGSGPAC